MSGNTASPYNLSDLDLLIAKLRGDISFSDDFDSAKWLSHNLIGHPAAHGGLNPFDGTYHWSDMGKYPNHPSYSNESYYSNSKEDPYWVGGQLPNGQEGWLLKDTYGNTLQSEHPMIKTLIDLFRQNKSRKG